MQIPTDTAPTPTSSSCPTCDGKTRAVKSITIDSLVVDRVLGQLSTQEGFRFCPNPGCDTAYHQPERGFTIPKSDVRVRIGQKETGLDRQLCYCFNYTAADIAREVASTGSSTIPDAIAEECRKGLDRCEEENPQGRCCLGNVRKAYRAIFTENQSQESGGDQTTPMLDCCGTQTAGASQSDTSEPFDSAPASPDRKARWATGGALFAAALSSACCWLPLVLVGFGASAAGVSGIMDTYRPVMLGATSMLLGGGFYLVYFRKPHCEPGTTCEVPNPSLRRLNRITLWIATVIVAGLAFFPNYSGAFFGSSESLVSPAAASEIRRYGIEGMTCAGCEANVERALLGVDGISRVSVSYDTGSAEVALSEGADPIEVDTAAAIAVEAAGYRIVSSCDTARRFASIGIPESRNPARSSLRWNAPFGCEERFDRPSNPASGC